MSRQIEIKDVPAQPFAFVQENTTQAKIGPTLAKILPEVGRLLSTPGVSMAGPPACRYPRWEQQAGVIEGGFPYNGSPVASGRIQLGVLGGCKAAFVLHVGPYDELAAANQALFAWIKDNGYRCAGPPWESYITDPGANPDPATWKTEIYCPIA